MKLHHWLELSNLKAYFEKNKKKVIKSILLSLLFFVIGFVIVGVRIFYPYHFIVSVAFLLLAARYLIRAFLFDRKTVQHSRIFLSSKKYIVRHIKLIILLAVIALGIYAYLTVTPNDQHPFEGVGGAERAAMIERDLHLSTVLMDNLELAGNDLVESGLLQQRSFTADENQELRDKWNLFLSVAIETEKMTDTYRYFNQIGSIRHRSEHAQAFIISYSLYIKKYEIFYKLIERLDDNRNAIIILNEYSPVFGSKNSYDDVLDRFFSSDSMLRRSLGRFYVSFLGATLDEDAFSESYSILKSESKKSFWFLMSHVSNSVVNAARKKSYDVEKGLSTNWVPIQKNIANIMSTTRVSKRQGSLISQAQIASMKEFLLPGDIFVERRNWFASNIGIPGFWPHAALYIGTLNDMEKHFAEVFPFKGYGSVRELLAEKHPELLEKYVTLDENGHEYSTIEGQSPGIVLHSIEHSADADYVGVMRTRLSKEDTFKSILRAFENYGKPYDYDFDFETRDELVCSELIYDAYLPSKAKSGVDFKLEITSGRKMVSPNAIVKKFDAERNREDRQLDFVYFLDGNEQLGTASVKGAEAFGSTWTRQKYSWFQE